MLDTSVRRVLDRPLRAAGSALTTAGVNANALTALGLILGTAACVAVARNHWWIGLGLWLANRLADGLDGPTARAQANMNDSPETSDLGGFFDIMADFAIYGGLLVAIGIAEPSARLAALIVFFAYYLSGSAFLAWSSLAATRQAKGDGRSLHFPGGLAEGTETIVAYVVLLAWRDQVTVLLWVWAAIVLVTAAQRVVFVRQQL